MKKKPSRKGGEMKISASKHKRTMIHCRLFKMTWLVQRGGSEQSAVDWYTKAMKSPRHILPDTRRRGHFTYNIGEKDAMLWFRHDAGTGTIVHEVSHAMVFLAEQLYTKINRSTDEIFAAYSGWLAEQIVRKLWY